MRSGYKKWLKHGLALAFISLAGILIYYELKDISFNDVMESLTAFTWPRAILVLAALIKL